MESKNTKDVIAEGIKALTEQLRAGNSAALTQYLKAMGMFHNYSFGNQMAIAMQKPDAERVAGFKTWKELGRHVRKGEKGIRILAPIVEKKKDVAEGESAACVYGFRSVCVFDVSQTEGAELPEFSRATGDGKDAIVKLTTFAESQGIQIVYSDNLGRALGLSCGGVIKIANGQTNAEIASTLAHEIAHELLHKQERPNAETSELEAEATAFIVGTALGLQMGSSSCDYIRLYNGNAERLTESLGAISKAAHAMLA